MHKSSCSSNFYQMPYFNHSRSHSDRITVSSEMMANVSPWLENWQYVRVALTGPTLSSQNAPLHEFCFSVDGDKDEQKEGETYNTDSVRRNNDKTKFSLAMLSVLFAGMELPEPVLMQALLNNPPIGFFSLSRNLDPPPALHNHRRHRSSELRHRFHRFFSPVRHMASKKRSFRPSTTSLPAGIFQPNLPRQHLSMVQLTNGGYNLKPAEHYTNGQNSSLSHCESLSEKATASSDHSVSEGHSNPNKFAGKSNIKTVISRLKRDIEHLETAIQRLESEKSREQPFRLFFSCTQMFLYP